MFKKSLLVVALLAITPAAAQSDMSPDDLINKLKLHPGGTTRGIRPLSTPAASDDAPAAAPSGVAPAVHKPLTKAAASQPRPPTNAQQGGEANLTVQFETGSDRLTPAAIKTLDTLGQALSSSALSGNKFSIVGHTDSVGRPDMNQQLSERRAQAVVAYIAGHFNVDRGRLTASGKGQSDPLVPTGPGVAEPQNRRVQIINLGT